jgi:hypothetical protein
MTDERMTTPVLARRSTDFCRHVFEDQEGIHQVWARWGGGGLMSLGG